MSCPKCEPAAGRRRWLWWAALAALLVAGAWLDRSSGDGAGRPPAALRH